MKKRLPLLFSTLILILFFSCCSGGSSGDSSVRERKFENGKVIQHVTCIQDKDLTYSLYLPGKYNPTAKFPVILAFDPHGSGDYPLESYHELAEKYGYILIGSNDSKNGNSISESARIISGLFTEVRTQYSVDTNRIFAMGFSGGARIASLIGLFQGGVCGVIGCGAGFPGTDQPGRFRFDYIGFAGMYDFNMNELIRLDEQLDEMQFHHSLILFRGIHEWPAATLMEKAFIWSECCSMRKNLIPRNDAFINGIKKEFDGVLISGQFMPDKLEYHRELKNAVSFLQNLAPTDAYKKQLTGLEIDAGYQKQLSASRKLMEKEIKEEQELADDLFFKDLSWWKGKIAEVNKRIGGKDSTDSRMCRRMKGYLSLMAYMNYTRLQNAGDSGKVTFAFQVYQVVDPENAAKIKK